MTICGVVIIHGFEFVPLLSKQTTSKYPELHKWQVITD